MDRCGTPSRAVIDADYPSRIISTVQLTIFSEGREKADPAAPMVADYLQRIQKFIRIEDYVLRPGAKSGLVDKVRQQQEKGAFVIAMDELGKEYSSTQFAKQLNNWIENAPTNITFVIGGAEGLPPEIKSIAKTTFALSKMTLPHRFARLLLMEQLYRAFCIQKNIPYHK